MIDTRLFRKSLAGATLAFCLFSAFANAQTIETTAREALVIDATTDTVLLEHNADERMPTASMSKIMTMYMVFEALDDGRLAMDDLLSVSERAWRIEGSRMFIEVGDRVPVEDLVRGVIVQSGNDAAIAFAEALGGTEEAFARQMTERARELGMVDSSFMNSTGLPDPNHYSTAHDLALLAEHLISEFPQYYHYYSELEFTWNDITQGNRNPLLYRDVGADGLKTGHTSEAGYGLTGSAVRDGRRIIVVVNGLDSAQARADEAARLLEWAFREFDAFHLFDAGETVTEAEVWQGDPSTVPLVVEEDLAMTLRQAARDEIDVVASWDGPIPAPIAAGDEIGILTISAPGMPDRTVPLVAGASIAEQGFLGRIASGVGGLIGGIVN
ncbi:MAG: D-alanyl-D-alanine carboxypeptidase family protein [Pseudomonadota bacterium]